jgi:hypothetical protein
MANHRNRGDSTPKILSLSGDSFSSGLPNKRAAQLRNGARLPDKRSIKGWQNYWAKPGVLGRT